MFIVFKNLLTVKCIRKILKIRHVKFINDFNKNILLTILNENQCSRIIQRHFRKKTINDDTCPISYERLKYPFISFKVNDVFLYYDFNTIITYFNKTRNFLEPLTRTFVSDTKIEYINNMIRYYFGKNSNKIIITDTMIKNVELGIITFCLNDLATEINSKNKLQIDDLYNNFLPRLIYYIHILKKNHCYKDYSTILNAFIRSIDTFIQNADLILDYVRHYV